MKKITKTVVAALSVGALLSGAACTSDRWEGLSCPITKSQNACKGDVTKTTFKAHKHHAAKKAVKNHA